MNEFYSIIAALGPVFCLVVIGHIMGRYSFPSLEFWPSAERFTYYFLFPVLLTEKIANASLPTSELSNVIYALVLLLLIGSLMVLAMAKNIEEDPRAITSIFQGGIRFNTYVGMACAGALFGEQGLIWSAVFLAIMIPLVNIASITCFAMLLPENHLSLAKSLFFGIVKNPLIIACFAGGLLNLSELGIPAPIKPLMSLIGGMALPLGLLAVGVGLDFKVLRRGGRSLWYATIYKLFIYPLIFLSLAFVITMPVKAKMVILLFTLLPTAPSSYILSRQLNGDSPLMAAIITLQTLVAMISIPFLLLLVSGAK